MEQERAASEAAQVFIDLISAQDESDPEGAAIELAFARLNEVDAVSFDYDRTPRH